jgi:hypothetical protein
LSLPEKEQIVVSEFITNLNPSYIGYEEKNLINLSTSNPKFIIETEKYYNLLQSFRPKQAFYIFVALNNISEIISNRNDFIKYCIALDIYKIPTYITSKSEN